MWWNWDVIWWTAEVNYYVHGGFFLRTLVINITRGMKPDNEQSSAVHILLSLDELGLS